GGPGLLRAAASPAGAGPGTRRASAGPQGGRRQADNGRAEDQRPGSEAVALGAGAPLRPRAVAPRGPVPRLQADARESQVAQPDRGAGASGGGRRAVGAAGVVGARRLGLVPRGPRRAPTAQRSAGLGSPPHRDAQPRRPVPGSATTAQLSDALGANPPGAAARARAAPPAAPPPAPTAATAAPAPDGNRP